jgi:serine/threonine protein kinase
MMDPCNYKRRKSVGKFALCEAGFLAAKSKLTRQDHVEKLSWDDVEMLSTPIGHGGYSNVFKVTRNGVEYALKCLNPGTMLKTKQFRTGAVDLALEGEILSRLCHENVIKLHGISRGGPLLAYVESDRGYFLVLDLLEDTLQDRLDKCRSHHKLAFYSLSSMLGRVESVALGIAKGMEYLHKQGVALRDLKPDNVGFDANGTPKIFDLGFAREVHTIIPNEVAGTQR